jgi:N-methylhydantoinase B
MGLILASAGKAVAQNAGLSGGHPGNTGLDVIARQSRVADLLASGRMQAELSEVSDTLEPGQNYSSTYLAPGEVFHMTWQGGGGYGDPLTRDPDAVARDVRELKVTAAAARSVYGVVLANDAVLADDLVASPEGPVPGPGEVTVDASATAAERDRQRSARQARSRLVGDRRGRADLASARRLDDNLVQVTATDGGDVVACGHCGEILGDSGPDATLTAALYEGPPTDAGPQIIATASDYVDAAVVFRQFSCPGCWTALYSAVVPSGNGSPVTTPLGGGLVTA